MTKIIKSFKNSIELGLELNSNSLMTELRYRSDGRTQSKGMISITRLIMKLLN